MVVIVKATLIAFLGSSLTKNRDNFQVVAFCILSSNIPPAICCCQLLSGKGFGLKKAEEKYVLYFVTSFKKDDFKMPFAGFRIFQTCLHTVHEQLPK